MNYRMKAALQAVGKDLLDTLKVWCIALAIVTAIVLFIAGSVLLVVELGVGALSIALAVLCAGITATHAGVQAYKRGW